MKRISNKYLKYGLLLIAGIFLGWLFFHSPDRREDKAENHAGEEHTIWTCSMHPQIRRDKPGDCPICGMDLIPLAQSGSAAIDPETVHLSTEAAQLANVMTSVVSRQKPVKEVRLYGMVKVDERLLQSQVAHVPGRIEKLTVNFTGEAVKKGQVLAEIYSPELINAQQELLQTLRTRQIQPDFYEASRERLRQWKLTEGQISEIESSGKIMNNVSVHSNSSGTVTARNVSTGDYVSPGTVLFEIADLSKVWVLFDAYESDLSFLNKGKKVSFTLQALPGKEFSGNISFIDPVLDPVTRVAGVRVEIENKSGLLKPEMFVTGIVSSNLAGFADELVIPSSAVLWTGKRSIVYIKEPGEDMIFKMREIEIGPMLGDSYIVSDGLGEGEEIVTNGTFSVDAAAQLEGKPSMMNPVNHGVKPDQDSVSVVIEKLSVDRKFYIAFSNVYENYLVLKNALVESDAAKATQAASTLQSSLGKVDMKLLKGDAHDKWMVFFTGMSKSINSIATSGELGIQRSEFSPLSDQLYNAIKLFGLPEKVIYRQFCPMAFDNKGAYWLSEMEEIRNPYFGDEMLTCGEVKELIR